MIFTLMNKTNYNKYFDRNQFDELEIELQYSPPWQVQ